jgi:hypothetical protein
MTVIPRFRSGYAAAFFAFVACALITLILINARAGSRSARPQEVRPTNAPAAENSGPKTPPGIPHQPQALNAAQMESGRANRAGPHDYATDVVAASTGGLRTMEELAAIREALSKSGRASDSRTQRLRKSLQDVLRVSPDAKPHEIECFSAGCIVDLEFESDDAAGRSRNLLFDAVSDIPWTGERVLTGFRSSPSGTAFSIVLLQH